jgi:hypothetical protein
MLLQLAGAAIHPRRSAAVVANFTAEPVFSSCRVWVSVPPSGYFRGLPGNSVPVATCVTECLQLTGIASHPRRSAAVNANSTTTEPNSPVAAAFGSKARFRRRATFVLSAQAAWPQLQPVVAAISASLELLGARTHPRRSAAELANFATAEPIRSNSTRVRVGLLSHLSPSGPRINETCSLAGGRRAQHAELAETGTRPRRSAAVNANSVHTAPVSSVRSREAVGLLSSRWHADRADHGLSIGPAGSVQLLGIADRPRRSAAVTASSADALARSQRITSRPRPATFLVPHRGRAVGVLMPTVRSTHLT